MSAPILEEIRKRQESDSSKVNEESEQEEILDEQIEEVERAGNDLENQLDLLATADDLDEIRTEFEEELEKQRDLVSNQAEALRDELAQQIQDIRLLSSVNSVASTAHFELTRKLMDGETIEELEQSKLEDLFKRLKAVAVVGIDNRVGAESFRSALEEIFSEPDQLQDAIEMLPKVIDAISADKKQNAED
jgi:glutamate-1-semialdehyde aminotransferase